ncbi:MAG: hypothetical protein IT385_26210 [Deltaproteobacteria bacterium]|nr:hypothetical protein [Deltaproteobacteria bacterium]
MGAALALLFGLVGGVAMAAGGPVGSEGEAIARLREAYAREVEPALAPEARRRWSTHLGEARLSAREGRCDQAARRVRDTLGPADPAPLHGSVARLAAGDRCWTVSAALGFTTLLGYVDAARGELLFLWSPPEG